MKLILKFDALLDFFLPREKQGKSIHYELNRRASVKDIIEASGVPHTEIGNIVFNGRQVNFCFVPSVGGRIEIEAVSSPLDVSQPSLLRPEALSDLRFIADVNVIRLGKLMILLGFDVTYSTFFPDEKIADIAEVDGRIVLTRDTDLLKRKKIVFARRLRANFPYDQLREVVRFFGLEKRIAFFSRCTRCNVQLAPVNKGKVLHLLEPKTKKYFNIFYQCPKCRGVFWKGSHYENIREKMSEIGVLIKH